MKFSAGEVFKVRRRERERERQKIGENRWDRRGGDEREKEREGCERGRGERKTKEGVS